MRYVELEPEPDDVDGVWTCTQCDHTELEEDEADQ
jgi:hypothetical protein